MTMIERVARVISPEFWETQDGLQKYSPDYWAMPTQVECRKKAIDHTRRVIAAMREPTPSMVAASRLNHPSDADIYRAMIDAALTEGAG